MAFSFQPALSRPLDRVRALAGDVHADAYVLDDQAIEVQVAAEANETLAAAACRDLMLSAWEARAALADKREVADSKVEFDLQYGSAEYDRRTAVLRRRGRRQAGHLGISGG